MATAITVNTLHTHAHARIHQRLTSKLTHGFKIKFIAHCNYGNAYEDNTNQMVLVYVAVWGLDRATVVYLVYDVRTAEDARGRTS